MNEDIEIPGWGRGHEIWGGGNELLLGAVLFLAIGCWQTTAHMKLEHEPELHEKHRLDSIDASCRWRSTKLKNMPFWVLFWCLQKPFSKFQIDFSFFFEVEKNILFLNEAQRPQFHDKKKNQDNRMSQKKKRPHFKSRDPSLSLIFQYPRSYYVIPP